jgi:hypothetical protein
MRRYWLIGVLWLVGLIVLLAYIWGWHHGS